MKRCRWIYCLAILALAPSAARAQVQYTVTDLSEIWSNVFPQPERVERWFALSINNNGQVGGYAETLDNSQFALCWDEDNGLQDLSGLGQPSWAFGINNRGQLAVDGSASLWDPAVGLQPIKGWGDGPVTPVAINDAEQVAGLHWPDRDESHAFLWENGVMQDLGNLGGEAAAANGINSLGEIVGYSETLDGSVHAFVWNASNGIQPLADTGRGAMAYDVNAQNEVVGITLDVSGARHACLWEEGRLIDIHLSAGQSSCATSINNVGQIVGSGQVPEGTFGFLWDSTGTMQELNDLIPAGSGWDVKEACDINDRGWIVATAMRDVGGGHQQARAVLLTPVPEPCAAVLLLSVAGVLLIHSVLSNIRRCQNANATGTGIGLGERSLGRLNVVSFHGYGVRTEAQRWRVILPSRSEKSYTGC